MFHKVFVIICLIALIVLSGINIYAADVSQLSGEREAIALQSSKIIDPSQGYISGDFMEEPPIRAAIYDQEQDEFGFVRIPEWKIAPLVKQVTAINSDVSIILFC